MTRARYRGYWHDENGKNCLLMESQAYKTQTLSLYVLGALVVFLVSFHAFYIRLPACSRYCLALLQRVFTDLHSE